ncbi:MAG: hypothetical protein ACP5H8_02550 [Candidatus Micrarchaeia archaeon]
MAEKSTPASEKHNDIISEPMGASFKIAAKLNISLKDIAKKASSIPGIEIVELKDRVALIKVESRDIDNIPYLFIIIYLNTDSIEVMYTVTPEISLRKRRLELLRYVSNVLAVMGDAYTLDITSFMQVLDVFLAEIGEFATSNYEKLYVKYDTLLSRVNELKRQIEKLEESNNKLSRELIEMRNERDQLKLRVDELEKYSDDTLMLKIQEWIREHGNEINIDDFCKLYKVRESRVEQLLNKMVYEGYLEIRR